MMVCGFCILCSYLIISCNQVLPQKFEALHNFRHENMNYLQN